MSGVTVQWWIQENAPNKTILYFESFERSIVYNTYSIPPYLQGDTGWVSTGKKAAESLRTDCVHASGDSCYDVEVEVKLACEEWIIGPDIGDPYHMTYYFVEYPEFYINKAWEFHNLQRCKLWYISLRCQPSILYINLEWERQ